MAETPNTPTELQPADKSVTTENIQPITIDNPMNPKGDPTPNYTLNSTNGDPSIEPSPHNYQTSITTPPSAQETGDTYEPTYELTGNVTTPNTTLQAQQEIYFKNELTPTTTYSGKNIIIPVAPDITDYESPNITEIYKSTLKKHKIKNPKIRLSELIEMLYDDFDDIKNTKYISSIEIALKKYIKENGPINRYNTDLNSLLDEDNEELQSYKEEAKAYLEFLDEINLTYKIEEDEGFQKIIETNELEIYERIRAITPEALEYIKDLEETIANENIRSTPSEDSTILNYLEIHKPDTNTYTINIEKIPDLQIIGPDIGIKI